MDYIQRMFGACEIMLDIYFELLWARVVGFAAQVWLGTTVFGARLFEIGFDITFVLIVGFIGQYVVHQFLL